VSRLTAAAAAAAFAVEGAIAALTHSENDVYRVDTPDGRRLALRIHRPGARQRAEVESELGWLAALRADTGLVVPEPVASPAGDRVVELRLPADTAPRLCVLFRWVEGEFLPPNGAPEAFGRVGRFVGRLHAHATEWRRPTAFRRGRFDLEAAARSTPDDALVARMPPGAAEVVAAARARFRAAFESLGTGPDVFGLIHADLHQFNVLLCGDEVRAIDFDDCCDGHFLYDLAVALVGAGPWRTTPAMRAALLAGYRRERALPAEHERLLGAFMAVRRLLLLRWSLGANPPEGPIVEDVLARVRADLGDAR
jgi:Ser/Thr protein kinase RdoA (MazF antagonist)